MVDMQSYDIHLYRDLEQESASQTFNICGGKFPEMVRKYLPSLRLASLTCKLLHSGIVSDPQEGIIIESFEYITSTGFQFTVVSDSQESTNELRQVFSAASELPKVSPSDRQSSMIAKKKSAAQRFIQVTKSAGKQTWRMGSFLVLSLERIGDGVDNLPNRLSRQDSLGKSPTVRPSNAISGVAYGTKSMLTKVFSAVAGVIVEPVRGARQGGVKGGALGFGKGMLGLVCKPVKGTIDLVTQTTRGISNTPKTMYVGMTRMIKTKPRTDGERKDHTIVGEQGDEVLYISKR